jgi:hypothetical protein
MVVELIAGRDAPSVRALGLGLRRTAAARSLDRVEARALDLDWLVTALAEVGYAPADFADAPFLIFEWRGAAGSTSSA